MQSLEELRQELDEIDDQMTALFEQRMKVCEKVAEYKIKNGRKVLDKTRENAKLSAVASKVSGDFNKKGIQEIYEQLMALSRKLQYQKLGESENEEKDVSEDEGRIRLSFDVPHHSGSLYHLLSHFVYNDLNILRIESRLTEGETSEYRIFVDIEGRLKDAGVKNALQGIQEEAMNVKILEDY